MSNGEIVTGVTYQEGFLNDPDAALAWILDNVETSQHTGRMFGKTYQAPRLEAWYGSHGYRFSGRDFPARPLPAELDAIRLRVEMATGCEFSGVLVNVYRDGQDCVAWHSDDEPDMGEDPFVASVSLGAPRDFLLRRKTPAPVVASAVLPNRAKVRLDHGSLLVMGRGVQADWEHSVPRRKGVDGVRVNLTFRG